ncbi:MAG: hypothetical protein GY869_27730 [Planctomycetes bacterium]|nr:hypothetical protein [Planctomycetota bacterium]
MISDEKIIQNIKKYQKNRKTTYLLSTIPVLLTLAIVLAFVIFLFNNLNKNTQEIITEELNISIIKQQETLYYKTLLTANIYTSFIFWCGLFGLLLGGLIAGSLSYLFSRSKNHLIVSMWEKIKNLEQQIQSNNDYNSDVDT